MTPASFDYLSPASLEEALGLLKEHGDDAKILAGGQSLIPLMKLRFTSFPYVIDVSRIKELKYIRREGRKLTIGALTTTAELEESGEVRGEFQIIHDACSNIADPLVRNMGTVGGNLSHGDPGNDLPAVMIALKARFNLQSASGKRSVSAGDYYKDTFTTDASPEEMLVSVEIEIPDGRFGAAYVKHKRRAGDFSVAGVAVAFSVDGSGRLGNAGVGLTSLGPTPLRSAGAEKALEGSKPDGEGVRKAVEAARADSNPSSDFYGSREYKLFVLGKIMEKCVAEAAGRAQKEGSA